jgi:lipopolysaccharide/colanic/teichoic acid biosynthesis glycosyltransferase
MVKRAIDIAGSTLAILFCLPLLLAIAAAVKLTSSGPVLFRQTRLGQDGKRFIFLKFRSMYVASDQSVHKEYMQRFISGESSAENASSSIYKLETDPRITPVGRLLRRSSLDELPQLVNVLIGDMSLVGPRPPIPYEFRHYATWHRRRLLVVKPGLTGLWQVKGRSRMKFDDMVRLDLEYARSWSIWGDLHILLQTPRAVISGDGAY